MILEELGKRRNGHESLIAQKSVTKGRNKRSRGECWPEAEGAGDADVW